MFFWLVGRVINLTETEDPAFSAARAGSFLETASALCFSFSFSDYGRT
jgi:hypothetical protein